MMKDLIFITAYCPTEKQEEALNRCIDSVLKLGFHILLLSHSHIPLHIQKKCNYYFYDYDNDVSEDYNLLGHNTFGFGNQTLLSRFFVKTFCKCDQRGRIWWFHFDRAVVRPNVPSYL